jgi:methionyl-tRNA formyltransferase
MGTPEFAVPSLEAVARRCEVAAVVTQPDRGAGRGRRSSASEVSRAAESLGLQVFKPADVNDSETAQTLRAAKPDLFAVVAFGSILSPDLLAIPRLGSVNLHGSLLPYYRGASPVQRVLWDGLGGTGVTTLWMDEGIDTGDMILQHWTHIEPADDAGALARRLAELGAPLLAESLVQAHAGTAPRIPQPPDGGSYASKMKKSHGVVDWSLDALSVWNRQRAVTPWPGAMTTHAGRRLRLHATWPHHVLPMRQAPGTVLDVGKDRVVVACGTGALALGRVQSESRGVMAATEWARGARVAPGDVLGEPQGDGT